ncbi:hypothetical protein BDN72DRAFT_732975, partial [Pluteus cervinus]
RSHKARQLWRQFSGWLATPQTAMQTQITSTLTTLDLEYKKSPVRSRPSKSSHEATKAAAKRKIEEEHYRNAREEWNKRLKEVNLVLEDWDDITVQESEEVERALG